MKSKWSLDPVAFYPIAKIIILGKTGACLLQRVVLKLTNQLAQNKLTSHSQTTIFYI